MRLLLAFALSFALGLPAAHADAVRYDNVVVVAIGVSDYPDTPLPNATRDVRRFADLFRVEHIGLIELYDEKATRRAIIRAIRRQAPKALRAPGDRNLLIVYFVGHGHTAGGIGFLAPHGAQGEDDWLPMSRLRDIARQSKAFHHQLYILGSCFGGDVLRSVATAKAEERQASLVDDPPVARWVRRALERRARVALTAGSARQKVPDGEVGHGSPFGRALVNALRPTGGAAHWAADFNRDGCVSHAELAAYVEGFGRTDYNTPRSGVLEGDDAGTVVLCQSAFAPAPAVEAKPGMRFRGGMPDAFAQLQALPDQVDKKVAAVTRPVNRVDEMLGQMTILPKKLDISKEQFGDLLNTALADREVAIPDSIQGQNREQLSTFLGNVRGYQQNLMGTPAAAKDLLGELAEISARIPALATEVSTSAATILANPLASKKEKAVAKKKQSDARTLQNEAQARVKAAQDRVGDLPARAKAAINKFVSASRKMGIKENMRDAFAELQAIPNQIDTKVAAVTRPLDNIDQMLSQMAAMPARLDIAEEQFGELINRVLANREVTIPGTVQGQNREQLSTFLADISDFQKSLMDTPADAKELLSELGETSARIPALASQISTSAAATLANPLASKKEKDAAKKRQIDTKSLQNKAQARVKAAQGILSGLPGQATVAINRFISAGRKMGVKENLIRAAKKPVDP